MGKLSTSLAFYVLVVYEVSSLKFIYSLFSFTKPQKRFATRVF